MDHQYQLPLDLDNGRLLDSEGRSISCRAEDLGTQFGYELPDDQFRKPYMARKLRLTFEAAQVPPLGYKIYAWIQSPDVRTEAAASPLRLMEQGMANDFLAIGIREDGSYDVTDKHTGKVFKGLGVYENCGDVGNEYVFRQPEGDVPLTTRGLTARISLAEHEPYRITYEIVHDWKIPASADAAFAEEKRQNGSVPAAQGRTFLGESAAADRDPDQP